MNLGEIRQRVTKPSKDNFKASTLINLTGKDFVNLVRTSNGQQFIELSLDPINNNTLQSTVQFDTPFRIPMFAEAEVSVSQRVKGTTFTVEVTDNDVVIDTPTEVNIIALSQYTTTLTITIDTPFDGYIGSWVDIYGLLDSRFNYSNLCIASISTNRKVLVCTVADEATIPSVTGSPVSLVGAKLIRQAKVLSASNVAGIRLSGTSTSSYAPMVRFNKGSIKSFGTLVSSQLISSTNLAPSYISGATGNVELKPLGRIKIDLDTENTVFLDTIVDANTTETARAIADGIKPESDRDYFFRFRGNTTNSISRPIAKIKSIAKTGTTTATIVTDVPHGLTAGVSVVGIYGVQSQTNFANATATVLAIINATSFTITHGSAVTATSYGGFVSILNAGITQQGAITASAQSIARAEDGVVTVIGSTTWASLGGVGEYVNLHGILGATGNDLGFDGVYRVNNFTTTTLTLEPVYDLDKALVLDGTNVAVTPTGGVVVTTPCGGGVILRSTLRIHDVICSQYMQQVTKIAGQGTTRMDLAVPVIFPTGQSVNTYEAAVISPSTTTLTTAGTTNATLVKSSAGNIYELIATNMSATPIYVKVYNKATAPTVGTDIPILTIPVPAYSFVNTEFSKVGLRATLGLGFAITGALADTDATVVTAGSKIAISYI